MVAFLIQKIHFRKRPLTYGLSTQKGSAIRVILFKDPAVQIRIKKGAPSRRGPFFLTPSHAPSFAPMINLPQPGGPHVVIAKS